VLEKALNGTLGERTVEVVNAGCAGDSLVEAGRCKSAPFQVWAGRWFFGSY